MFPWFGPLDKNYHVKLSNKTNQVGFKKKTFKIINSQNVTYLQISYIVFDLIQQNL